MRTLPMGPFNDLLLGMQPLQRQQGQTLALDPQHYLCLSYLTSSCLNFLICKMGIIAGHTLIGLLHRLNELINVNKLCASA